jgi:aminomethyltransferase
VVVNAGTRDKDTAWLKRWRRAFPGRHAAAHGPGDGRSPGPEARAKARSCSATGAAALELKRSSVASSAVFVARTGYTGEDGWEVMLPAKDSRRVLGRRCECAASLSADSARATRCASKRA